MEDLVAPLVDKVAQDVPSKLLNEEVGTFIERKLAIGGRRAVVSQPRHGVRERTCAIEPCTKIEGGRGSLVRVREPGGACACQVLGARTWLREHQVKWCTQRLRHVDVTKARWIGDNGIRDKRLRALHAGIDGADCRPARRNDLLDHLALGGK
eukprot:scaffold195286_cov30-Tisochrysis_lutea.AAC.4